jgi:hypothetical protein
VPDVQESNAAKLFARWIKRNGLIEDVYAELPVSYAANYPAGLPGG